MTFSTLTLLHVLPTLLLTGLIWFVQVVHYPLFARVGEREFRSYEPEHVYRTTWVVAPLMIAEAVLALMLVLTSPSSALAWTSAGLALLVLTWAVTMFEQVPCHARLQMRANAEDMQRLVNGNWIRTAAWSGRSVIALALIWPVG